MEADSAKDQAAHAEDANTPLADAIEAAELLLAYAAEQGAQDDRQLLDKADIETIVRSKHNIASRALSEEEESSFWDAYRRLCLSTQPVSRESLEATKTKRQPGRFFGTRHVSAATGAVRYYQIITVISILALLAFQSYWVFVSTLVNDLGNIRNQINEISIEMSNKSLELLSIEASLGTSDEVDADTAAIMRRLNGEIQNFKDRRSPVWKDLWVQYDANIAMLQEVSIVGRVFYEAAADHFEHQAGKDILQIQAGAISLEVMSLYLLPILYGLVGACAYILRTLSEQIKDRTFKFTSKVRLQLRMVLGALAGLSIAWFAQGEGATSFLDSITPLALAFLAGYSVELLFSAMDAFIEAFSSGRASD